MLFGTMPQDRDHYSDSYRDHGDRRARTHQQGRVHLHPMERPWRTLYPADRVAAGVDNLVQGRNRHELTPQRYRTRTKTCRMTGCWLPTTLDQGIWPGRSLCGE